MPRPVIRRRVSGTFSVTCFVPADYVEDDIAENVLKHEEMEAIRLKDLEGLEQAECASRMAVSRPTFQRILLSAREKVADSLLHGKAIRVDGGVYVQVQGRRGHCARCGRAWDLPGSDELEEGVESTQKEAVEDSVTSSAEEEICPDCAHGNEPCPQGHQRGQGKGRGRRRMGQGNP